MLSNSWESRPIGFWSGNPKTGYTDHANEENLLPPGLSDRFSLQFKCSRSAKELPFPVQLHHMMDMVEHQGLSEIVSWQCHGRCFIVHKQKEFVDHIMKQWFRQTKFPSFQRQLNLYGFKRINSGKDKGAYYHELFLRTKRFLTYRIERLRIKGTKVRKPAAPNTEPDFYAMPFLPTTHTLPCVSSPTSSQKMVVMDPAPATAPPPSMPITVPGASSQETSSTVDKKLAFSKQTNDFKVYDPDLAISSSTGQLFVCAPQASRPPQVQAQTFKSQFVTVPSRETLSSKNGSLPGTNQMPPHSSSLQQVPYVPTNPYATPALNQTPARIIAGRSNSPTWFPQEQQSMDADEDSLEDSFDELIESLLREPKAAALTTPVPAILDFGNSYL